MHGVPKKWPVRRPAIGGRNNGVVSESYRLALLPISSFCSSLSSFALVFGPLFYLTHEAAWNHFGPSGTAAEGPNPLLG